MALKTLLQKRGCKARDSSKMPVVHYVFVPIAIATKRLTASGLDGTSGCDDLQASISVSGPD